MKLISFDEENAIFYTRKLASVPSLVALPINHRLAAEKRISISQLKKETFARYSDDAAPGYTKRSFDSAASSANSAPA